MDFFILGNPRSGTTLLRLMLNAHSKIGVPPECGMIQWWYEKYKNWSNDTSIDKDQFIKDLRSSKKIDDWNMNKDDFFQVFEKNPNSYSNVFDLIYKSYTGKEIIGDKNNYYIHHLNEINEIYPTAKYIHLVRDGRDIACSYLKINTLDKNLKYLPKLPSEIKDIAREWDMNVKKTDRFLEDKNSITLKYEDLITKPESTLENICEFLGISFDANMLDYFKKNDEPKATLKWKEKTLEPLDNVNFNKFNNILTKVQIAEFNNIAGNTLKKYKYVT